AAPLPDRTTDMRNHNALLLPALAFLFAPARVEATDFTICNKGTVTGYAATASRNGNGFFTVGHTWKVSGWYEVAPGKCSTVFRGENTFSFEITDRNIVVGTDVPAPEGGSSGRAPSGSPGGSIAKTAGEVAVALIIGKAIVDALDSRSDASGAPTPFATGTLNAVLLGKKIARRASGSAPWYYEDGSRVNP